MCCSAGEALAQNTGWRRETGNFEMIRNKRRKLTKLYLILKMCSTRVEISLGITFYKLRQLSAVHFAVHIQSVDSEDSA
jgi:hypothetical protein